MEQCDEIKDTILKDYEQINEVFYQAQSAVMFEEKKVADECFVLFSDCSRKLKEKYKSMDAEESNMNCINAFICYLETLEAFYDSYLRKCYGFYEFAQTLDQLEDEQMNELDNLIQELDIKIIKEKKLFENQMSGNEDEEDLDF